MALVLKSKTMLVTHASGVFIEEIKLRNKVRTNLSRLVDSARGKNWNIYYLYDPTMYDALADLKQAWLTRKVDEKRKILEDFAPPTDFVPGLDLEKQASLVSAICGYFGAKEIEIKTPRILVAGGYWGACVWHTLACVLRSALLYYGDWQKQPLRIYLPLKALFDTNNLTRAIFADEYLRVLREASLLKNRSWKVEEGWDLHYEQGHIANTRLARCARRIISTICDLSWDDGKIVSQNQLSQLGFSIHYKRTQRVMVLPPLPNGKRVPPQKRAVPCPVQVRLF